MTSMTSHNALLQYIVFGLMSPNFIWTKASTTEQLQLPMGKNLQRDMQINNRLSDFFLKAFSSSDFFLFLLFFLNLTLLIN